MGDGPFNIAKGRAIELYNRVKTNDPPNSALVVLLLKAAEADDDLIDHDDLAAVLAAAGNTEADFTNYVRKVLTDADLAALPGPDDVNNWRDIDIPDQEWLAAGGVVDNNLVKKLVCYDPDTTSGTDADIIPLSHYDYVAITDGNKLVPEINPAGFYRAT